ncbi:BZ3500_MvSof-1268-A1-R1_Chr11-1g03280 [Microbotryum saponariae]|uniref:BZ3500_MvSof-1268-A1-R1_Chr11-1g03280 protein n=1 Tax=Microbotryum saponariae TaxID=289078 RepID=A0A2X0LG09_9BASI|nr:BZ3501_MvSof-1269-A2-R1_Chr11g02855 [Microbotryum saponariae]SDA03878.1 BZ3500_MvSof-1268-A1-R1_Chr11-1g03280 [Microbotryum saponariae]
MFRQTQRELVPGKPPLAREPESEASRRIFGSQGIAAG